MAPLRRHGAGTGLLGWNTSGNTQREAENVNFIVYGFPTHAAQGCSVDIVKKTGLRRDLEDSKMAALYVQSGTFCHGLAYSAGEM